MTFSLTNVSEVVVPSGRWVKFSVTLLEGGEPLMTSKGWLFNPSRQILPPATRTKYNKWQSFIDLTPAFEARIRAALEAIPLVLTILGPVPVEKVAGTDGLRKVEGEVEI